MRWGESQGVIMDWSSLRIRFLSVVQDGASSWLFGGSPVRRWTTQFCGRSGRAFFRRLKYRSFDNGSYFPDSYMAARRVFCNTYRLVILRPKKDCPVKPDNDTHGLSDNDTLLSTTNFTEFSMSCSVSPGRPKIRWVTMWISGATFLILATVSR